MTADCRKLGIAAKEVDWVVRKLAEFSLTKGVAFGRGEGMVVAGA